MTGMKQLPARADLIDYNHTVAGHAGTMCDADGELFIKPCTQAEIDFYNSAKENHPDFADLMPLFMGTLMMNDAAELSSIEDGIPGSVLLAANQEELTQPAIVQSSAAPEAQLDTGKWVQNKSKKIKTDQAVVLENAGSGFASPNFLDVKLGERLWADDAPIEKKQRFDEITRKTTHGPLGFRIAGMKVWRGSTIKSELDQDDYKVYDKDYGRTHVNTVNVVDTFRKFIFNKAAGIDDDLARAVAQAFLRELRTVEQVLASHESRMYSASLLFVFEGAGDKLRDAIAQNNTVVDRIEAEVDRRKTPVATTVRVDSGIELMDEDVTMGPEFYDGEEDDEDNEDDGPIPPKIYTLKLIDFAHAQWTPGQGPDENVLKGVRSLIRIFDEMAR